MSKKIYKPKPTIAPKINFNSRLVSWRVLESKKRMNSQINIYKYLFIKSVLASNEFSFQDEVLLDRLNLDWSSIGKKKVSFKNYCFFVGRGRSVNRDFFMSRHTFRKFARFGFLPGVTKERC